MFFSKVRLNPTRRGTVKFLASPQAMHAVVMGSCGPGSGQSHDSGRVLWRVDQPERHVIELYVVSPDRPDFTGLVEQAGWPTTQAWDTTSYQPFLDRLVDAQRWRFRLTANPIRLVPSKGGGRWRVSPHRTRRHQEQWILEHSKDWGFTIPELPNSEDHEVALVEREQRSFGRLNPDGEPPAKRRVDITRATYAGVLEIADADTLRRSLTHGIGRAKAYGCGLLTLAPLH